MQQSGVILIDVERIYADLFSDWCVARGLPMVRFDAETFSPSGSFGLCVLSISAEDPNAFERVRAAFKTARSSPVVVLMRNPKVELVVRLIHLGIADVLELPAPPNQIVANAMSRFADSGEDKGGNEFIGQAPAIRELKAKLKDAARVRSTVLIEGETGTGKGVLARRIHEMSDFEDRGFVHVDCAALSPSLIESELFGHEKGAFTGAAGVRRGRFETAGRGTIFLDEIGDLDAGLQTKLLRVLGDRWFERVGGSQGMPMQARVIAATSRKLLEAVQENHFRKDLYFRLNVLHFQIPPLRERLDDIPLLVQAGLNRICTTLAIPLPTVSKEFYEHLTDHRWPGNVRELMNLLERVLVRRRVSELLPEDLESVLPSSTEEVPPPAVFDSSNSSEPLDEAAQIAAAIHDTGGNLARAARRLDVPRGTLRYRIKKFGLEHLVPKD